VKKGELHLNIFHIVLRELILLFLFFFLLLLFVFSLSSLLINFFILDLIYRIRIKEEGECENVPSSASPISDITFEYCRSG
jgi:hypothetical protein